MTATGNRAATFKRVARYVGELLVATYRSWRAHRAIRLGAGLAYYGVFAVVPLLTLAVAVAGLVFSQQEVQAFLLENLESLLGAAEAEALANTASQGLGEASLGASVGAVGLASLLLAASLIFVALQDAFNVIWDVPVETGLRHSVHRRMLAFAAVFLSGAVLIAALVVETVLSLVYSLLQVEERLFTPFAEILQISWSWLVIAPALMALYRLLPHASVSWRQAAVGAAITAVLLWLGTWAIGSYLRNVSTLSASGLAGGAVLALVWIYYESQILLAGAELTKTLRDFL